MKYAIIIPTLNLSQEIKMEQYTRTKINNQLQNLGWFLSGTKKNVFQEEPRTKEERKLLGNLRPDYVLYSSNPKIHEPLAVIETKSTKVKGLDGAIKQAKNYAETLKAPIVFATDGVFYKTEHAKFKKPLLLNTELVDSLLDEKLAILFRESWDVDERPKEVKISQSKLIDIFSDVNDTLRKQGLLAGYERFSEFATILFLKLFSEKELLKKNPRISQVYTWEHLAKVRSEDLLEYVSKVIFPEIARLYKDEDIFDEKLRITNPEIFRQIYNKLDPLQLTYVNEDIKGGAFEYFLANSPSADKDLGEYFTPRHIVKTMVSILDPQVGEKIYDPFCGTGGMLIESYKHIGKSMESNAKNIERLQKETLFGSEITSNARIAKMNMILAGDGHSNIRRRDSLAPDNLDYVQNKFDIVITNFPFSQKTDYSNFYDIPASSGDSICLQHCIKALKDGGRMAIVVPQGLLFRNDTGRRKTREYLLNNCEINDIVHLPAGVFLPYTPVKTSIIYCQKKQKKNTKTIVFFDVKNDGFSLNNHRWPIKEKRSDIDKFLSFRGVYSEDRKKLGFTEIQIDEIRSKDYILNLSRYQNFENSHSNFRKLDDIVDIITGDRITQKNDRGTKYPVFGGGGESFKTDNYNQENTIVISRFGMSEHCVRFVEGKFWLLDSGFTVAVKEDKVDEVDRDYIFYALTQIQDKIFSCGRATAQKNIDFDLFKQISISVPSLPEQKKILNEVKKYNQLILKNQKIIKNNQEKIKNLIKSF